MSNFRDRKLLDLAHRLEQCQCGCGLWVPGCEPAHSNQGVHGKGMSIKAHDCFHAAMAHDHHVAIDQGSKLSGEERNDIWRRAFDNTLLEYWRRGWLRVV